MHTTHLTQQVLMEHMPRTETLTTEHIKSHLQKYRLHSNRCVPSTIYTPIIKHTRPANHHHPISPPQKPKLKHRSKDEFIEYFNGYLRGPFAAFCARKGWEQRRDRAAGDAAAFAAIPHHPSYVAPGDRQHHMRQIQVRLCVEGRRTLA